MHNSMMIVVNKKKVVVCSRVLRFIFYYSTFDDRVVCSDAVLIAFLATRNGLEGFFIPIMGDIAKLVP